MRTVVFGPHTDDSLFSIGSYLASLDDERLIISVFAGIPPDPNGRAKHVKLRAEHESACALIGADLRNGDFFDDVYPLHDRGEVREWLRPLFDPQAAVYMPLGIGHPDHVLTSNLLIEIVHTSQRIPRLYFYEELPYRVDYPEVAQQRLAYIENAVGRLELIEPQSTNNIKRAAVDCYQSQVNDDVIRRVMVTERIWKVVR